MATILASTRMKRILRVEYIPNGSFVLPILNRLQHTSSPSVRKLLEKWRDGELGTLGASLSTKLTMMSFILKRLHSKLIPLSVELAQRTDVQGLLDTGFTWRPSQRDLPYEALLELDSFIFEFRSAYEILGKLLRVFSSDILGTATTEEDLLAVLSSRAISTQWVHELSRHRKFLFHQHAPWLAYRVNPEPPYAPEEVFLTHIDADPTDTENIITLETLSAIYVGLDEALKELQAWAVQQIALLEEER